MSVYVGFKIGKARERKAYISEYYCGGCGLPVSDHDSYCPECGGAFRKEDATERTCDNLGYDNFVCSKCGFDCYVNSKQYGLCIPYYCPNCGAEVVDNE